MTEYFLIANMVISLFIFPVLGYIVSLEKRITRLETKIEILCKKLFQKDGDEN